MQQVQGQNPNGSRLSTSSHSSVSAATNAYLNGLLSPQRSSQTLPSAATSASNLTASQLQALRKETNRLKRSTRIQHALVVVLLTIVLALLLVGNIELATKFVRNQREEHLSAWDRNLSSSSSSTNPNRTKVTESEKTPRFRSYFACIWLFNGLLFVPCLIAHSVSIQRRSRRGRTLAVFLREFVRIFDNDHYSSSNTLLDYFLKTCLLCFLWYLSCYLMLRSMSILLSAETAILYSIIVTFRQLLGWIFLHEQFIGNKIIAHILALSALLFLAHNDGFRFNKFLLGLSLLTCAVGLRTTFDILLNTFAKDLNSAKLRIAMINVCLYGICLLWPFVLLVHVTGIEPMEFSQMRWPLAMMTLFCALAFNALTIVVPLKYTSTAIVASLLFVIPSTAVIDHYLLQLNYSPLVISAIVCSFVGVLLSMVPKGWFQTGDKGKMKHAWGLLNKDASTHTGSNTMNNPGPVTGKTSAFEEIRAQRRLRDALANNDGKP